MFAFRLNNAAGQVDHTCAAMLARNNVDEGDLYKVIALTVSDPLGCAISCHGAGCHGCGIGANCHSTGLFHTE